MNRRNTTSINLFGKYSIQKLFYFLLLSSFILLNSSCDECKDVICENGNCENGNCICEDGYSGISCQYKDPCYDVTCQNRGVCDNGTCKCPDGYTGTFCQTQQQNPCENINCLNGGTCKNGTCDCRPGYSGIYCQTYDLCHNINCKNGGTCISGQCNCPTGYDGTYCQNERTPISVEITRIDVENFSLLTESGDPADDYSLPDLRFKILRNDIEVGSTCYIEDAHPNEDYILNNSTCDGLPIYIYYPKANNVTIKIRSYDYDSSGDDVYLGGYFFDFENNGFPSTRTLYNSNSWHRLKVKLHLEWIF